MFYGESGDMAVIDGGTETGWTGGKEMRLLKVGQKQM
jgi:hypothetical protein